MRFEMKNLTSFPMEKLCFDLKLEALEQMEPRDVYELAKVNQGFRGMLVRDPSIIFGEHVFLIKLYYYHRIEKFSDSDGWDFDVNRDFSFVKKVRWCDDLTIQMDDQFDDEINTLLKNLKSVNRLELYWRSKEALEIFFSNFHASIKKEATLNCDAFRHNGFQDRGIEDLIENFLVAPQLKDCEMIHFLSLSGDSIRFCYNALLKAEIKNVFMSVYRFDDWIVHQIITNGIPSKNPEAAVFLNSSKFYIRTALSENPGMRRVEGENRLRLLEQANDVMRNFGYSDYFMEESPMFRRRFDSTKDCICVYEREYHSWGFLAFYVPVD